jgi:hypothetical protein
MNKAPRRVTKIAVRPADQNRRASRTDIEENARILLSTSRFRTHEADSTRGCLGAPMRYGAFSFDASDEPGGD